MYDFISGGKLAIQIKGYPNNVDESNKDYVSKITEDIEKGYDWFRENNPKAFEVLFVEV